jgi:hypothetical protein
MKKIKFILILSILYATTISLNAQNTIYQLNGKKFNTAKFQIDNEQSVLFYQFKKNSGKTLTKSLELSEIYSLELTDGSVNIFYSPAEDEFSIEEMKFVLDGKHSALNTYRPYWAFAAGFVAGAGSMLSPYPFYALSVPIALNVGLAFSTPSSKHINKHYPDYSDDYLFVNGYKQSGRKKILKNSVIGTVAGIGIGIISGLIIESATK